jgi:HlyD family secretion protein
MDVWAGRMRQVPIVDRGAAWSDVAVTATGARRITEDSRMIRTRITTAAVVVAAAVGGGLWFHRRADAKEAPAYRFASVERGSVHATVSATGALSAVRTVQVGTQASGKIVAIYVDFNDRVKKGQLIARIDPTLQQQSVVDAQAGVERAQAQLDQAQRDYDREKQLFDAKVVTESEFVTSQANYRVAEANLKSAQIALDRARQNLSYTDIYAPIDGVIVERDVDVGQTVAASLSAPQLFLIANDLSQMQILASVDESDIGKVKDGQPVTFTVSSYPNETFTGSVHQVRLQSKTTDNVVNYTVVVSVDNPSGKLLPGMTATVQFLTSSADDVLTVPNAALRFRPPVDSTAVRAPSTAQRTQGAQGAQGARSGMRTGSGFATLWHLDAAGKLAAVRVRTGLTDGQRTQVQGTDLQEGMQVVIGTASTTAPTGAPVASPFQQQRTQRGGPPGAF